MTYFPMSTIASRAVIVILLIHTFAFYVFITRNYHSPSVPMVIRNPTIEEDTVQFNSNQRIVNSIVTEYNFDLRKRLDTLIADKVSPRDQSLISLIREMMDPPSNHMLKSVKSVVETPQSKAILKVLQNKKNGFFIEAGGLDGERSSNTLFLEQKLGWKGLLVEMDPYFYTQLLGKSRRSWSINACIGPSDFPIMKDFKESSGGGGQLLDEGERKRGVTRQVPCFPLESLLLAINVSHVDYFSLDVEGFELDVLKTIPFERLDISTFSVEYLHGKSGKASYKTFMEGKGYTTHQDIVHTNAQIALYVNDYIFVKQNV